jgi:hypothetical protein
MIICANWFGTKVHFVICILVMRPKFRQLSLGVHVIQKRIYFSSNLAMESRGGGGGVKPSSRGKVKPGEGGGVKPGGGGGVKPGGGGRVKTGDGNDNRYV